MCASAFVDWVSQACGVGRVTNFTVTTPHLTQLPPEASKKGNWGVFLFIKQKETKTIFIANEAILNLETK